MFWLKILLAIIIFCFILSVLIRAIKQPVGNYTFYMRKPSDIREATNTIWKEAEQSNDDFSKWIALFLWLDITEQNKLAEEPLRKALEKWPNEPTLLLQLAWVMVDNNSQPDECISLIKKAELAGGDRRCISDTKAWRLFKLGHFDEAWNELAEHGALTLAKRNPVVASHAAFILDALGDYKQAKRYATLALAVGEEPGFNGCKSTKDLLDKFQSFDALGE